MKFPIHQQIGGPNLPTAQINKNGHVVSQNAAFRQLTGDQPDRDHALHRIATLLAAQKSDKSTLLPFQDFPDGEIYWLNIVHFEDSTAVLTIYPSEALTDIDNERDEMRERILQLETFIETSYDGFWICDHKGRVIMINKAAVHLNGLEGQNIIGRRVVDLVAEGYYDRSVTNEVLEKKKPITAIVNSSNGKKLLATGKPMFDQDGHIKNVIVNVRDVTILNELRRRLKKTEAISQRYRSEALKIRTARQIHENFTYCSPQMGELMDSILRVAETETTVLIRGESGVGKSLLAECIHALSNRPDGPFFTINCSSLPPNLIESELFGYKGGAFTGASSKGKPGLVEMSEGGTLFLDEIAELPMALQAKLLDFMENTSFTRVGGVTRKKIDTRIICATNQDLDEMVREKLFREDLYFRLSTVPVQIPPIRTRPEDVTLLINTFLRQFNEKHRKAVSLSFEAQSLMLTLDLPGNVRELKHMVERLVVMADDGELRVQQVKDLLLSGSSDPHASLRIPINLTLAEAKNMLEKKMIELAVSTGRNQKSAAASLGLNQSSISRKINKYNINSNG